jgi:hypothetical protein
VASVKLFRVVLLPAEGLPTRPIKGSRGIVDEKEGKHEVLGKRCQVELVRCRKWNRIKGGMFQKGGMLNQGGGVV